mgnify:CR=1 FL=1
MRENRFTEKDVEKAKRIIEKMYPNKHISANTLGILGKELSDAGVKENGQAIMPTHNAVKRLLYE